MNASNVSSMLRRHGRALILRRRPGVTGSPVDYPAVGKGLDVTEELRDGVTITLAQRRYAVAAAGLDPVALAALIAELAPTEFSVVEDSIERGVISVFVKRNRSEVTHFLLLVRK